MVVVMGLACRWSWSTCSQKTSAVHSRTHATLMAACRSSASESSRSTRMPMETAASCVRCADAVQDVWTPSWRTEAVQELNKQPTTANSFWGMRTLVNLFLRPFRRAYPNRFF